MDALSGDVGALASSAAIASILVVASFAGKKDWAGPYGESQSKAASPNLFAEICTRSGTVRYRFRPLYRTVPIIRLVPTLYRCTGVYRSNHLVYRSASAERVREHALYRTFESCSTSKLLYKCTELHFWSFSTTTVAKRESQSVSLRRGRCDHFEFDPIATNV